MNENNEMVSVIIPSYGGGQYLQRSIESVLSQTYKNIECIVVDDNGLGCPNQLKTAEVMRQYAENKDVYYITHEVNINGSAARNTGVKHSHGEYICLLDDDDVYYPDKIEKQISALKKAGSQYGLTYYSVEIYEEGKPVRIRNVHDSTDYLLDLLLHKQVIGSSSLMIRKSLWNDLNGFDESFKRHQDYEFTARAASITKILPTDFVGFRYFVYRRNNPKNFRKALEYRNNYLNKMDNLIRRYPSHIQREIIAENKLRLAMDAYLAKEYKDALYIVNDTHVGIYKYIFLLKCLFHRLRS